MVREREKKQRTKRWRNMGNSGRGRDRHRQLVSNERLEDGEVRGTERKDQEPWIVRAGRKQREHVKSLHFIDRETEAKKGIYQGFTRVTNVFSKNAE